MILKRKMRKEIITKFKNTNYEYDSWYLVMMMMENEEEEVRILLLM